MSPPSSADQAPDVLIAERYVHVSSNQSVRVAAQQLGGRTLVSLSLGHGRGDRWEGTSGLEFLPHAVPEVIRALGIIAHAVGVRT